MRGREDRIKQNALSTIQRKHKLELSSLLPYNIQHASDISLGPRSNRTSQSACVRRRTCTLPVGSPSGKADHANERRPQLPRPRMGPAALPM